MSEGYSADLKTDRKAQTNAMQQGIATHDITIRLIESK